MKKAFFVFLIIVLLFQALPAFAIEPDALRSQTAVLMDYDTGQVLFEKGMHQKAYPASTTKIMTAILAVENAFPDEVMSVSKEAIQIDEPQSSHIALVEGEELTVDAGLFAMMLPSANDAANVVAEYIGGSLDTFAAMMTAKAHMIGAVDTNFANAHGLHEEDHYTTAYDLALITRYAAGDDRFMRYFGRDLYTMEATNKQAQERPFSNYQYMLIKTSRFYDPDVLGGKVGYTNEAMHTMSTVAERDGRKLICVVMGSPNRDDKFSDTQKLLEYGFDSFQSASAPKDFFVPFSIPIMADRQQVGVARFAALPDFPILMPDESDAAITAEILAPEYFNPGDRLTCEIAYTLSDSPAGIPTYLGTQILVGAEEPLPQDVVVAAYAPLKDESKKFFQAALDSGWMSIAAVVAGLAAVTLVLTVTIRHYALLRRRKARMQRMRLQRQQEQKRVEARKDRSTADKIRIRQTMYRM